MLILKGFLIGIGKIIPGVSGSLIAISLGIYEKMIESLVHLFDNFKKNVLYLGTIGIGVLIAIIFFSNIILYCLNNFYLFTMFFFIGLMLGNIPNSFKIISKSNKKNYLYFLLSIILVYIIYKFKFPNTFIPTNNIQSYFIILIIGLMDAFCMVVPGISGTALFMMLNCYSFIINLFSNPFDNIIYTIFFGIGTIIGIFITSFIMNILLKKYNEVIHFIILGFTFTSIITLIIPLINILNMYNIIPSILLFIISFILATKIENLS